MHSQPTYSPAVAAPERESETGSPHRKATARMKGTARYLTVACAAAFAALALTPVSFATPPTSPFVCWETPAPDNQYTGCAPDEFVVRSVTGSPTLTLPGDGSLLITPTADGAAGVAAWKSDSRAPRTYRDADTPWYEATFLDDPALQKILIFSDTSDDHLGPHSPITNGDLFFGVFSTLNPTYKIQTYGQQTVGGPFTPVTYTTCVPREPGEYHTLKVGRRADGTMDYYVDGGLVYVNPATTANFVPTYFNDVEFSVQDLAGDSVVTPGHFTQFAAGTSYAGPGVGFAPASPPDVSNVAVVPAAVVGGDPITVTADVATTTGATNVVSAEYTIDGGAASPMTGNFGASTASVQASANAPLALGTHTACVQATDGLCNVSDAVCVDFTVVPPDQRGVKQGVRDALAALLPTGDGQDDHRIEKAIDRIDDSLDPSLWVDGLHLDAKHGKKVFDRERQAVQELGKVDNTDVSVQIGQLVDIDRKLAQTAIDDAVATPIVDPKNANKVAKDLDNAYDELADGDSSATAGDPPKAVEHYRKAWENAQKAIEDANK